MNGARINTLRAAVEKQCNTITKDLLSNKETADKRSKIETAFRTCRDAFMEVSTILINLIEEKERKGLTIDNIKKTILDVMEEHKKPDVIVMATDQEGPVRNVAPSYAAIVGTSAPTVNVSRGPSLEVPTTTSFLIVPNEENATKFASSQATREMIYKVLKPSDCALKINKIALARDNGVRVEANSPDLDRVRSHPALAEAGLKVVENAKSDPRLIIHGIPSDMSIDEIRENIIAQNLNVNEGNELKIVYLFPPKPERSTTSCVVEVSPSIRKILLKNGRIYIRFSACTFSDYVRILQCYKCLSFGHVAKNCKSDPTCGHCSEGHEMKDCKKKDLPPKCGNCVKGQGSSHSCLAHQAIDAKKCPILCNKIKAKIAFINYG